MAGNLTAMIAAIFSGGVSTDPYFNLTTLLLSTTATNGQQNNTFQDSSTNNFTITRNGNTTQGTFSPFSQTGWGGAFNTSTTYLTVTDTANLRFGSSNFTIEAWVYRSASGATQTIASKGAATPTGWVFQISSADKLVFTDTSTSITGATSIAANTWTYVAVVRAGTGSNQTTLYVNGTSDGTGTSATNFNQTSNMLIGADRSTTNFANGYISNLRLSNTNRTISSTPTTALTADANTIFLSLNINRFQYTDSTAAFTNIAVTGTPSVAPFSPFNPTSAWSASTVGGSGYFDGTGDYLTANDNAALELGSSNFCIEFLYYPTSSANSDFVTKRVNASSYGLIIVQTGLALQFWLSSSGSSWDLFSNQALGSVTLNAWNHLAIYRIGNAWYSSLNGTITTLSASLSGAVVNNAANWNIGGNNYASGSIIGYLSNFRLVIGSSVYTSTSAPIPTAPLTAITNTQLLLNFTNSGIYDATAKNVLETVGNAQVSTTQSKWSPTSMYFDGTGDYLAVPDSRLFDFTSSDWTIEFWMYRTVNATQTLITKRTSNAVAGIPNIFANTSNKIVVECSGQTALTPTGTISNNVWTHVAIVRSGSGSNNVKIYFNGTADATSVTWTTMATNTSPVYIGADTNGNGYTGYLQDIRISRYARYTANFSVPTAAFPVQ